MSENTPINFLYIDENGKVIDQAHGFKAVTTEELVQMFNKTNLALINTSQDLATAKRIIEHHYDTCSAYLNRIFPVQSIERLSPIEVSRKVNDILKDNFKDQEGVNGE
jgi:hypothetical protein